MKKLLSLLLAGIMVFAFASCTKDKDDAAGSDVAGSSESANADADEIKVAAMPEVELEAEGIQSIAEPKAEVAILKKTVEEYLNNSTMFFGEDKNKTYADFVEYIGCEATEYEYNKTTSQGNVIWKAVDNDTAQLCITFEKEDGEWKLAAAGSTNLDLEVNKQ